MSSVKWSNLANLSGLKVKILWHVHICFLEPILQSKKLFIMCAGIGKAFFDCKMDSKKGIWKWRRIFTLRPRRYAGSLHFTLLRPWARYFTSGWWSRTFNRSFRQSISKIEINRPTKHMKLLKNSSNWSLHIFWRY